MGSRLWREFERDDVQVQDVAGRCIGCDLDLFFGDDWVNASGWAGLPDDERKGGALQLIVYVCPRCFVVSGYKAVASDVMKAREIALSFMMRPGSGGGA